MTNKSGQRLQWYTVPELPSQHILNPVCSYFSVIVPEESVNLIYNPEVFTLDTYSNEGGPLAVFELDSNEVLYGINSLRADYTNVGGGDIVAIDVPATLIPGEVYTFSFYVKGTGTYNVSLHQDVGDLDLSFGERFEAQEHIWTRVEHTFTFPGFTLGGTTQHFHIQSQVIGGGVINLDGFQLEQKGYATTFLSGNQQGLIQNEVPSPYSWTGTPHNSPSIRSNQTRAGGRVVSLLDMGFHVTSYEGFGLPQFDHITTSTANGNGSIYNCSSVSERDLSIEGVIYGCDLKELLCHRAAFTRHFSPTRVRNQQPIKMLIQFCDECGDPICNCMEALVVYEGGLEGEINNLVGEEVSIDFTMYEPYFQKCGNKNQSMNLFIDDTANDMVGKTLNGEWDNLDGFQTATGGLFNPSEIKIGPDGNLYATSREGMARWDGTGWTLIANYTNAGITDLVNGPDNKMYVSGRIATLVGNNNVLTATASEVIGVACYDTITDTWETVMQLNSANLDNIVNEVEFVEYNGETKLAIGGSFGAVFDPAGVNLFATRNFVFYDIATQTFEEFDVGGAPSGVGGPGDSVNAITQGGVNNNIYIGGDFTEGNAENVGVIRNGSAVLTTIYLSKFTQGGTQYYGNLIDGVVNDLEIDAAGYLYAGGSFTASDRYAIATGYPNPGVGGDFTNIGSAFADDGGNPGAIGGAIFTFAKLGPNDWDGMGIIGIIDPGNPAGSTQGVIEDIEIGDDGNIHLVGEFNYASNTWENTEIFPNGTVTNGIPASDTLAEQDPNINSYIIWNGSEYINPGITFDYINGVEPDLIRDVELSNGLGDNRFASSFSGTSLNFGIPPGGTSQLITPGLQNNVFVTTDDGDLDYTTVDIQEIDLGCADNGTPIITIVGPGKLIKIVLNNYTAQRAIEFDDLTLECGEQLVLDFTQPIPTVISNINGSQLPKIKQSSILSGFRLTPSVNNVGVFMDPTTTNDDPNNPDCSTVTEANFSWREDFWSIDSSCCECSEEGNKVNQ